MEKLSNCCGAKIDGLNAENIGRCRECGEGCGVEVITVEENENWKQPDPNGKRIPKEELDKWIESTKKVQEILDKLLEQKEMKDRVFTYLPEKHRMGFLKELFVRCFGDKIMGYDIANNIITIAEMYQYKDEVYITREMQIMLSKLSEEKK